MDQSKVAPRIYWVGRYPPDDEYSEFKTYEDALDIAKTMAFEDDYNIIAIWDMTDNRGEMLALVTNDGEFTP